MSAVGGVGLDGFHIPGVASGQLRCGEGFRRDDGYTPSLGLSVDTNSVVSFGTLTLLWCRWLRNCAGALPGPGRLRLTSGMGAASDCMTGLPAEMACSDWAVAYGGPWIPWILC